MLYSLLNGNAKNWWYYKELRKGGNTVEARKGERSSIRREVTTIREAKNGGYAEIAPGGRNVYTKGYMISGASQAIIDAMILRGIPTVDLTEIPAHTRSRFIVSGPMIAVGREPEPFTDSLSYIDRDTYFTAAWYLGAKVWNLNASEMAWGNGLELAERFINRD